MKCERVIAWLLGSSSPELPPTEVAQHLERCFHCRQHWQRLLRLESVLAAGRGDAHTHGLEDFLRRHDFTAAAVTPARQHDTALQTVPTMSIGLPENIRGKTKFVWWLLPIAALMGVTVGVMIWGLVIGLRRQDAVPLAQGVLQSESGSARHDTAAGPTSEDMASVSSAGTRAHIGPAQPTRDPMNTKPIDAAMLLARARSDTQILWQLLDNVVVLIQSTQVSDRTACVGTLTCQLGEEALRLAELESVEDTGRFVDRFAQSAAVLVRMISRAPDANRADLVRRWQDRLSAIASSARKRALASPSTVSARLQQLATHAEHCGAALRELAADTLGLGKWSVPGSATPGPDNGRCFSWANEKDENFFELGANEWSWLCVLYVADGDGDAETEGNPTAYLLLSSVRMELINLAVVCGLRLAEEDDPLLRINVALDMTEAVLRTLALVCSAGDSAVGKRLACHLNAMILATIEANWPERDSPAEGGSPERRKSWYQAEQRLADLLAVLQLNDQETPVQPAWLEAMREVQHGIEALEAACERGAPQVAEESQKPLHGSKPSSRDGQVLPTIPKPANKPHGEKPSKPEKTKPPKPPLKPGKPFPERFKDLKELWHGRKR